MKGGRPLALRAAVGVLWVGLVMATVPGLFAGPVTGEGAVTGEDAVTADDSQAVDDAATADDVVMVDDAVTRRRPAPDVGSALRTPPVRVTRIAPVGGEGMPGAGAAVFEGARGEVRVDFGSAPVAAPAHVGAVAAEHVARRFVGRRMGAGDDLRPVSVRPVALWEGGCGAIGAAPVGDAAGSAQAGAAGSARVGDAAGSAGAGALAGEGCGLRWGWAVHLVDPFSGRAERVYVDGLGRPRGRVPLGFSAGLADVYDRSPLDGHTTEVTLTGLRSPDLLESDWAAVSNCIDVGATACYMTPLAVPDLLGDWRFVPDPLDVEDAFAEVNVYHHLERAQAYFEAIGLGERARPVAAIVNFRVDTDRDTVLEPFANAMYVPEFWSDRDALIFGQAAGGDLAYDASIIHHEMGHLATEAAELWSELDGQGLNHLPVTLAEGYSDYFAAAIGGEPVVGAYFGTFDRSPDEVLRRLDGGLSCPEDLSGEPHWDGRIWAGALWSGRSELGPELDAAVAAAIRALPRTPSVVQAAEATRAAVEAHLGAEAGEAFGRHLEAAGIDACTRQVPFEVPGEVTGLLPVTYQLSRLSPGALQYVVTVPPGAEELTLRLQPLDGEGATGVLHVRAGAPVTYRPAQPGLSSQPEAVFDAADPEQLVLTADTVPPVIPGTQLFVSPANASDRAWRYRITAEAAFAPTVREVGAAEGGTGADRVDVAPAEGEGGVVLGGGCSVAAGSRAGGVAGAKQRTVGSDSGAHRGLGAGAVLFVVLALGWVGRRSRARRG